MEKTDRPIKVLLVDDEPDFIDPIAFWLKSRGYFVDTALSGEEAIQKVKTAVPDIVFMDINMPSMNGIETLKSIRAFNKDLPIVMVTAAFSNEDNINKAKELGISGFFTKNYTFDELVQMIQVTLRTHRVLKNPDDGSAQA